MLPLSDSQREMLEEAVTSYQRAVSAEVARYLLDRGISRDAAVMFRLGYVAEPAPGHEHVRGRLAIPYLGHDDRVLSIRFRCLRPHNCKEVGCPKYLSLVDEPTRLFNVRAIHEAGDEIHTTEGELDAIILNMVGLPACGWAGVNAWSPYHRRMLAGFSRVWHWGDPDAAGSELTNKVTRALPGAKAVRLRDGDVTETYLLHGKQGLLDLISTEGVN